MTNRIDRLAGRGLVRRRPDPADGRGVMVQLEDGGRLLADAALADLLQVERGVLSVLDPGEHERLSGILRDLLTTLE
jgi:DNA-binding MarR family transcriptional regulator